MARRREGKGRAWRLLAATLCALAVLAAGSRAQELGLGPLPAADGAAAPAVQAPGPGQPAQGHAGVGGGTFIPAEGWTINLGLTVAETYTDNLQRQLLLKKQVDPPGFYTIVRSEGDFITRVTPSIAVHGDTPNVNLDLFYSPFAQFFAEHANENGLGQNLNARAHVMVAEDLAYIDAFGFAAMLPALGNFGYGGYLGGGLGGGAPPPDTATVRNALSQVYSFGVTPYLVHRFGGWGTAKVGVSAQTTTTSAAQFTNAAGTTTRQPANNTQTLKETAQFTSGENLGRLQSETVLSGAQNTGTGLARNSSNNIAQTALTYAMTRWAAVFGQIGYETFGYNTATTTSANGFHANYVDWTAGTKFTFGEDGFAKIGYGRRFGSDSISFDGAYSLTARTRLTGRYWTGFGTELQLLQADLANAGIDPYGMAVNVDTGAPIFLAGMAYAGGNQSLYRSQNLNATLSSVIINDPVSLGFQMSQLTVVATAAGAAAATTSFPSTSMSVTASWQHPFNELLTGAVYAVYGTRDIQGIVGAAPKPTLGHETYLATSAVLNYTFSPTLTGSASYSYYEQSSQVQLRNYTQNLVMISLSKHF